MVVVIGYGKVCGNGRILLELRYICVFLFFFLFKIMKVVFRRVGGRRVFGVIWIMLVS